MNDNNNAEEDPRVESVLGDIFCDSVSVTRRDFNHYLDMFCGGRSVCDSQVSELVERKVLRVGKNIVNYLNYYD